MTEPTTIPAQSARVDPNDPEELIASSIFWYPLLFTNRTDVFTHLLFTGGNGYIWDDQGRIVSYFDDEPERSLDLWPTKADEDDDDHAFRLEQTALLAPIRATYRERALVHGPVRGTVAGDPVPRYSLYALRPDHIHPQWKRILDEAYAHFAPAWALQSEHEQQRQSELDSDPDVWAATLARRQLDFEYGIAGVTEDEYTQTLPLLQNAHADCHDVAALADQHRESLARIQFARSIIVELGLNAKPTAEAPREPAKVLDVIIQQALMSTTTRGRRPLPHLVGFDEHWLYANLDRLTGPR